MFCSTIIPTVNRPTLWRAVGSVLAQNSEGDGVEVIVVNDSGEVLGAESWRESARVRVIDTNRRERSVARNTGAALAGGAYLHFLDDDDVMVPGAMEAFAALAARNPGAVWLYGGYQTVDNHGVLVKEFHPDLTGNIFAPLVSGESIPLQASLLRADAFFGAGTFDPAIIGTEDRDLGRRIALLGDVAPMACTVARIRIGEQGSTTKWSAIAENDRRGREKALCTVGAYARLTSSAGSAYWRGRVARAYLASTVWNLERRHPLIALERAAVSVGVTGLHVALPDYWRGLMTRSGQG